MITKSDCLSILVRLESSGININQAMMSLVTSKDIPLDVLKFIVGNQGLEVTGFYEMLRKKHNKNKSPLYTNILKDDKDVELVITTLSCLLTQIILYSNKLKDDSRDKFLSEARAEEITRVLNTFFKENDYAGCVNLLNLIKIDLMVLESLAGKREYE